MRLFLCEKPSQGRDIAQVVGANQKADGYQHGNGAYVTWCFGHLLELAEPEVYGAEYKRWSLEQLPIVPAAWCLEPKRDATKQLKVIAGLLKQVHEVVIATDADREGEVIAREVLERFGWRGAVSRLWLSALDPESVRRALANLLPGLQTEPLYQAGLGRARADWMVGMNLTRAFTVAARSGSEARGSVLSVGRVQTPTLRLVVDLDRRIDHFVPQPYAVVVAEMEAAPGQRFRAQWLPHSALLDDEKRCKDLAAARAVAEAIAQQTGVVHSLTTERKHDAIPLPHSLSSLTQEASKRHDLSAQQVLDAAQALYETHKATSYPRTDCQYLPLSQRQDVAGVLSALQRDHAGLSSAVSLADSTLQSAAWNDAKLTAHHAIVPTAHGVTWGALSEAERQVYDLICRRYLAQFYGVHDYQHTKVLVTVCGHDFAASGKVTQSYGWRSLYGGQENESDATDKGREGDGGENTHLPALQQGQEISCVSARAQQRTTKPPSRYTDGALIAAMESVDRFVEDPRLKAILRSKEKAGIGTDATRPAIIETLLKRGYLAREGKKFLVSTALGRALIEALPPQVSDPATTALWEFSLEEIAAGRADLASFIDKQAAWVSAVVEWVKREGGMASQLGSVTTQAASASVPREASARPSRASAKGRSRHPDAHDGAACPSCQQGALVARVVRQGPNQGKAFWGCSRRECNHFQWRT